MIGIAHHPVNTVVEAVRRCGLSCRVLGDGEVSVAPVHVIMGTRLLRKLQPVLMTSRTAIIVLDAIEVLREVEPIDVIDGGGDGPWSPMPIRMSRLRAYVCGERAPKKFVFVKSSVLGVTIDQSQDRGVLGSLMAYSRKLGNSPERAPVTDHVIRYLAGEINADTLRRRTTPSRSAHVSAHAEMCDALAGDAGETLRTGVALARSGTDPQTAAKITGSVPFEIRYVIEKSGVKTPVST